MTVIVSLMSLATMLVSGWMTIMYFVLRHPGYLWRAAVAATICAGAAMLVGGRPPSSLRFAVGLWGAAIAALGVWALFAPGDDGWVLVAGAIFIVEGVLAVAGSARRPQST